ncbi:MAG: nucleotidyltransferase family protein [Streptosporangiaceae bacterium]
MSESLHICPGVEPGAAAILIAQLHREPWLSRALSAVAASGLPDAWIGAGVIRDVVWGQRHGGFDPADVKDIDVAFFDPACLSRMCDQAAQETLTGLTDLPWEATNQAAVHTWYHEYFGGSPVLPFASVHDAVATWPETATCVAVRELPGSDQLEMCAPHGLADLLGGIWRSNLVRVTPALSMARLARQRVRARWPGVTIVPPGWPTSGMPPGGRP